MDSVHIVQKSLVQVVVGDPRHAAIGSPILHQKRRAVERAPSKRFLQGPGWKTVSPRGTGMKTVRKTTAIVKKILTGPIRAVKKPNSELVT